MTTPTDTHSAPRSLLIDRVGHSVLQRLLAGVNGPDLRSAALTCKAFYAVITAPRFYAVRRRHARPRAPRRVGASSASAGAVAVAWDGIRITSVASRRPRHTSVASSEGPEQRPSSPAAPRPHRKNCRERGSARDVQLHGRYARGTHAVSPSIHCLIIIRAGPVRLSVA